MAAPISKRKQRMPFMPRIQEVSLESSMIDYKSPQRSGRDAPFSQRPEDGVPGVVFHRDATHSTRETFSDLPCRDFFFDSDKVLSLNRDNFTTFLTRKDATLAMFYNDRYPESDEFQKVFSEAANNTKRENHAFVGVDCVANPILCEYNGVCKVPIIRLYSKTYCIGEIKTIHGLSSDVLRLYVEMAPVSDSSRMVACNRKKT